MIIYTTATSQEDLDGILQLQKANLPINLTPEEMAAQGFLTVVHSLSDLRKMNELEQHVIAKDNDKVVAYLLAMTAKSKGEIPILAPMFKSFDTLFFNEKPVADHNYIVVGQVCVNKFYRGRGILDNCYATFKQNFQSKYDFAITEIATKNPRSLNAHKRIGFINLCTYAAPDGVEWQVVIWNW
ncbi:MAG: GNAT family N-acetyltransferase [Bacteroidota bacterium]|nr:GNAT family N-acetyltransferase [Bacteroidota bacterium]